MSTIIYQLAPIETHLAAWGAADWELTPPIIPYKIYIYFGVSNLNEPVDWDNGTVTQIGNDILELSPIRESFDEEKNQISFQDVNFRVLNDSEVWDTILNFNKNTEVRIVYQKIYSRTEEEFIPVFWGVVDKKTIIHKDDVGFDDIYWGKYREYEFTAIEYTKTLQNISIATLRDALNSLGTQYFSNTFYIGNDAIPILKKEGNTIKRVTFNYITVKRLLTTIVRLIYPSNTTINIISNIEFYERNANKKWYLDTSKTDDENICIIFQRTIEGWATDYRETFFDDKDFSNNFSFYRYNNCLELFKELITNFNLTWKVYFTCDNTYVYKFNTNFKFINRLVGTENTNIISNTLKGITGKLLVNEGEGCLVTVTNYGDVTNNKLFVDIFNSQSYLAEAPATDKMIKYNTNFISYCFHPNHLPYDDLRQCFFGYDNGKIYPINKFVVYYSDTVSETYEVDVNNSELPRYRRMFGKAIANYYGGIYGIYMIRHDIIDCEVDTLDVDIFDYCIIDGKKYVVFATEKDLIGGTTKINIRNYL